MQRCLLQLVLILAAAGVQAQDAQPTHIDPAWWMNGAGRDAMFILAIGEEAEDIRSSQIDFLCYASAGLALSGDAKQAAHYLDAATKIRTLLEDEYYRDTAGWLIAYAQAWAGRFDEATKTIETIASMDNRVAAMGDVAIAHLWRGDKEAYAAAIAKAMESVDEAIKNNTDEELDFKWIYSLIAEYQLDAGDIDRATQTIKKWVTEPGAVADAYALLATDLAKLGRKDEAKRALATAMEGWLTMQKEAKNDEDDGSWTLKLIAVAQAHVGEFDAALDTVKKLDDAELDGEAFAGIAAGYATLGKTDEARVMLAEAFRRVAKYEDVMSRAWGYHSLAWYAAEAGLAEYMIEPINDLAAPMERAAARTGAGMGLLERAQRAKQHSKQG